MPGSEKKMLRFRTLSEKHKRKEAAPAASGSGKMAERCNRYALLLHFVCCFAGYFIIEAMSRRSVFAAWQFLDERTRAFLYNVLLIFMTTLPAFLFRRRAFYRVLTGVVWLVLGAANGIVLSNRVTPLTGPDFLMLDDALRVSRKYFSVFGIIALLVLLVLLVLIVIRLFFVLPRFSGKRRLQIWIPAFAAAAVGFYGLTQLAINAKVLSSYFGNIAYAYLDYGFPYSLSVTILDTGINEPNHYSEQLVSRIIRSEGAVPDTEADEDMPNIVVVQLETFFDVTRVKGLRFSEDPLPNWHALTEEYSSGFYTVPTVGAGTVNTEFETLTGMSLRFFGAGEYPYKGVLKKETCESAAYDLAQLGYTAHAVHNNESEFYGRREVYSNLGFNSFTPAEYMDTQDDVNENGWMRDENLITPVGDALDSTENRDFVFAVSVQPHGAYPEEPVITDPAITVSSAESDERNCQWEYYTNQLYEADRFVADLIRYLEERDEPTVCLFYGDHLPTMGLSDRDLEKGSIYQTNYLIWDNLGLERKQKTVTAYQAAAELFERIGFHTGTMFRYHQTRKHSRTYLYDMQVLQYDILYGDRYVYGMSNPFSETVLGLGVKPVRIDRIQKVSDGVYYVYGQNFTQSCAFRVNEELAETSFLNRSTLLVRDIELNKGDWINVAVLSNSKSRMILSTTNTLVYGAGRLTDEDD